MLDIDREFPHKSAHASKLHEFQFLKINAGLQAMVAAIRYHSENEKADLVMRVVESPWSSSEGFMLQNLSDILNGVQLGERGLVIEFH